MDVHPFLERFITQSAAAPEELDLLAVRQGRAMAPLILSGEAGCWANETIPDGKDGCLRRFEDSKKKLWKYAAAHPEHRLSTSFGSSLMSSINAGVTVARVWAYRELIEGIATFKKKRTPIGATKGASIWHCDQSALISLYLDLLEWEVDQDLFTMPVHDQRVARSSYGMRPGLLGLDYYAEVSATLVFIDQVCHLHDELWAEYLPSGGPEYRHSHSLTNARGYAQFVGKLYKRAYAAHGENIYTKLAVPRRDKIRGTFCMNHILLTPPLLAHKLVLNDTDQNIGRRVFPLIAHFAGSKDKKAYEMGIGSTYMRWFLPMIYNSDARRCAMKYLFSCDFFCQRVTPLFEMPTKPSKDFNSKNS
ncbi:unnamed protein product [Phytomonas sp. EM1]|nr:unnamed protein product [Phytomonas sp. EM1]|eukprot:CCW60551.1 unnamed protein product [Phytomonas sp. isolate EM1]